MLFHLHRSARRNCHGCTSSYGRHTHWRSAACAAPGPSWQCVGTLTLVCQRTCAGPAGDARDVGRAREREDGAAYPSVFAESPLGVARYEHRNECLRAFFLRPSWLVACQFNATFELALIFFIYFLLEPQKI